jgi:hypothetical protein
LRGREARQINPPTQAKKWKFLKKTQFYNEIPYIVILLMELEPPVLAQARQRHHGKNLPNQLDRSYLFSAPYQRGNQS